MLEQNATNIWGMLAVVIPSILVFVGSTINGLLSMRNNKKINTVNNKVDNIQEKQDDMHIKTNSRLDQLIAAIKKSSHAEGLAEGIKQEQDRIAEKLISDLAAKDLLTTDAKNAKNIIAGEAQKAKDIIRVDADIAKEKLTHGEV
jgi:uncharacterized membrane protein YcjF (UPF0283 family)